MEAMSVESIIQAYWQIQNYFTIPRFGFEMKGKNEKGREWGNYSDVDILAFKPKIENEKTTLILAESKAHGGKNKIIFKKFDTTCKDFKTLKEKTQKDGHINDLLDFVDVNVRYLLENKNLLDNLIDLNKVDVLKLQFVSTVLFNKSKELSKIIVLHVEDMIRDKVNYKFKVEVEIITHFDLICKLFILVQKDKSGKRYGNQILDFIREINRYVHVNECDGISGIKELKSTSEIINTEKNATTKYGVLSKIFHDKLTETLKVKDFTTVIKDYKNVSEMITSTE